MFKKSLKRLIALAAASGITVMSLAAYVPVSYAAGSSAENRTSSDKTFDDGVLTYTIGDNYTVSVTGCVSTTVSVNITEKVDGYTVTSIGDGAFSNCTSLAGVTIPDSVETLGEGVFYGCTSLQDIKIPSSIKEIPSGTFAYCTSLKEATLAKGVEKIDSMAFSYCSSLEKI